MRDYSPLKRLRLRFTKASERRMARRRQAAEKESQPKSWRERT